MNIRGDMRRGSSGGGADQLRPTEDETDRRNCLPDNRMPLRLDSASLTKPSPPHIHIGNSISRQVTFSKRRTALFKKANELSALCEADVAVLIFSSTNRKYEYASSSMLDILERYRQYNKSMDFPSTEQKTDHLLLQQDGETWRREALYLQQRVKYLTDVQSYMMGENLSSLSLHELQTVETNLGIALNRISARKMELLQLDSQTLSQKESFSHLQEENELLKRKVAELIARSDPGKTSSTTGTACSGAIPEFNAMTSCRAAHDDITLKLGL